MSYKELLLVTAITPFIARIRESSYDEVPVNSAKFNSPIIIIQTLSQTQLNSICNQC